MMTLGEYKKILASDEVSNYHSIVAFYVDMLKKANDPEEKAFLMKKYKIAYEAFDDALVKAFNSSEFAEYI